MDEFEIGETIQKASHDFESIDEFSESSPHIHHKYNMDKNSSLCGKNTHYNPLIQNKGNIKKHERDNFIRLIAHQLFVKEKYEIENNDLLESKSENNINNSQTNVPCIVIKKCSSLKKIPIIHQEEEFLCIPKKINYVAQVANKRKKRNKVKSHRMKYRKFKQSIEEQKESIYKSNEKISKKKKYHSHQFS